MPDLTPAERGILQQLVRMDIRKQERNRAKLCVKFGAAADLGLTDGRLGILRSLYPKLQDKS